MEDISKLNNPVGKISSWRRPNGLKIEKVSVPLGVIGVIYESRPNVSADAAALCLKSSNATILRGGSESFYSSSIIINLINKSFRKIRTSIWYFTKHSYHRKGSCWVSFKVG